MGEGLSLDLKSCLKYSLISSCLRLLGVTGTPTKQSPGLPFFISILKPASASVADTLEPLGIPNQS